MFDISVITLWLQQNPEWIAFGLCSAAFIESFAIIGIIIPGVILLAAISGLAAYSDFSIFEVIFLVYISSCLADIASFLLGKLFSKKIDRIWPFNKYPEWLEQGQNFFTSYGVPGVFLGRFVGPVRPLIPITAGSLGMDIKLFILVDLVSGLFWAPLYSLPGYFAGKTAFEGSGIEALVVSLVVLAIIFIVLQRYLYRKK